MSWCLLVDVLMLLVVDLLKFAVVAAVVVVVDHGYRWGIVVNRRDEYFLVQDFS
jgi:hypothetical protein